jgi:hypothetical protein
MCAELPIASACAISGIMVWTAPGRYRSKHRSALVADDVALIAIDQHGGGGRCDLCRRNPQRAGVPREAGPACWFHVEPVARLDRDERAESRQRQGRAVSTFVSNATAAIFHPFPAH